MSNINQFMGTGGIPLGSVVPMVDKATATFTDGANIYLKTGILAPISNNPALSTSDPWLTAVVGTQNPSTYTISTPVTNDVGIYYLSGSYLLPYYYGGSTGLAWSTNLTSWSIGSGMSGNLSVGDISPAGANIATLTQNTATSSYSGYWNNTGTYTAGTAFPSLLMYCMAFNPTGTLGVVCNGLVATSGYVATSTTSGASWTNQTPALTGSATGQIYRAAWSVLNSGFIYLSSTGWLATSTNGYTVTSGANTGLSTINVLSTGEIPNQRSASSSTSTIFSVNGNTTGGTTQNYLVRTTNGTVYNLSPLSTLLSLDSRVQQTTPPKVFYAGGAYYIYWKPLSGDTVNTYMYKSTDDGVTWVKVSLPIQSGLPNYAVQSLAYLNSNFVATSTPVSLGGGNYVIYTSTMSSLAATHIGLAQKSDYVTSGGSTIPNWIRIK